nr:NRPS module 13 and terminal condensation domain [Corallococcus coralloides]
MNDMSAHDIEDIYNLSPLQEGLLFHAVADADSGAYVLQSNWELHGTVDAGALRRAFEALVARHAIFRSSFHWEDMDQPVQVVSRRAELPFERMDLSALPPDVQHQRVEEVLAGWRVQGFPLQRAPLQRVALVELGPGRSRLLWCYHHLLLDGWSAGIVVGELLALYAAFREGRTPRLPPIRPYRDYIVWLGQRDAAAAEAAWRRLLAGFRAPTPLPFDHEGEAREGVARHGRETLTLTAAETQRLEEAARARHVTLNGLLMAAWGVVLARHTGQEDVVFGATVSGRPAELDGFERMVGLFINTLPVRVTLPARDTVDGLLARLREQQAELRELEHTPLVRIKDWSELPRDAPLFQSLFVFENYPVQPLGTPGERPALDIRAVEQIELNSYPLTLVVVPGRELGFTLIHDRRRLPDTGMRWLLAQLRAVALRLAEDGTRPLDAVRPGTEEGARREVTAWNPGPWEPVRGTLVESFRRQAAARPEAVAVREASWELTYAELDARSSRLAWVLRERGVGLETPVGLALERSAEFVVACLAILKAGGTYVPLDPQLPPERLEFILEDTRCALVIHSRAGPQVPLPPWVQDLCLDEVADTLDTGRSEPLPDEAGPDCLAYVMYTSGSTGRPKGIGVCQRGVLRLVLDTQYIQFRPDDVVAHAANVAFDAATFELWGALLSGGTLLIVPRELPLSPDAFIQALREERVSVLFLTPALFHQLAELRPDAFGSLRALVVGGDALDPRRARAVLAAGRPGRLINGYGPTETTTFATWHPVDGLPEGARSVPIGLPISRTRAYVLDARMEPVEPGLPGELWLGGEGVARGYVERPELTADRFRPDPYGGVPGARLYGTGDVVRRRADGSLEFLGRRDFQVKVRGFRIELGEVEAALREHAEVASVVVTADRDGVTGERRLVAYVVPRGEAPGAAALRRFLEGRLPDYMVPAAFVFLVELPLGATGKVDRALLPAPDAASTAGEEAFVAPRTPREAAVADLWKEVLGVERVGALDNFFTLGGDSILCIQVVSRAAQRGLTLSARDLFENPTVEALARVVREERGDTEEDGPAVGPVPLSPAQHWFLEGLERRPEPHHFNLSYLLEAPPGLDARGCEAVVAALVEHHDALRARFVEGRTGWTQEVLPVSAHDWWRREDLSQLPAERREAELEARCARLQRGLDMRAGPLARFVFFDLGEGRAPYLLGVVHHLVTDTVSWGILLEDLHLATGQVLAGRPIALPRRTSRFGRWCERLEEHARTEKVRAQLPLYTGEAWTRLPRLPRDGDGPNTVASLRRHREALTPEETEALVRGVPAALGCELNEALLAALACTLAEWSGASACGVLLEHHGREASLDGVEVSRTVGWFTALAPVLLPVHAPDSAAASLAGVRAALQALPEHGLGHGLLRYLSGRPEVARALREVPPPEVSWNYLGQLGGGEDAPGTWRVSSLDAGPAESPLTRRDELFTLVSAVAGDTFEILWGYSQDRHRPETVERLAKRFLEHVRALVAAAREGTRVAPVGTGAALASDEVVARRLARPFSLLPVGARSRLPRGCEDAFPLGSLQEAMVRKSLTSSSAAYQEFFSYELPVALDERRFARVLADVLARHPALRTSVLWEEGREPLQVVHAEVPLPLTVHDLTALAPEAQRRELETFMREERQRRLELSRAPLVRVTLHRLGAERFQLTLSLHHAIIDGWSFASVLTALLTGYGGEGAPAVVASPEGPSYRVFVGLEQEVSASSAARGYWTEQLTGAPPAVVPAWLRSREPAAGAEPATKRFHHHELRPEVVRPLLTLARELGVPVKSVFLAAHARVMGALCGTRQYVTGLVTHGRPEVPGGEHVVGCFINLVPLRVDLAPGRWADLVKRVAAQERELHTFRRFPSAEIARLAGRESLFEVGFNFVQFHVLEAATASVRPVAAVEGNTAALVEEPLWVEVSVSKEEAQALVRLEYDPSRLDGERVKQLGGLYEAALRALALNAAAPHEGWRAP